MRRHTPQDGYCLIYEDGRSSPIGEVRTVSQAERVVMSLWDKYGKRFHRPEPTSSKRLTGSAKRLYTLVNGHPIHAVPAGTDKKLCGGKFQPNLGDFAEPGNSKVTCEFCLGEIN